MPPPLRIKLASEFYHGTSRGDSRGRVPRDVDLWKIPRELRIGRLSAGLQDPTPFFYCRWLVAVQQRCTLQGLQSISRTPVAAFVTRRCQETLDRFLKLKKESAFNDLSYAEK